MSSWFKTSSTSQSSLSNTTIERPTSIAVADTRSRTSLRSSTYSEPKQNVKVAGVDKLMSPAAAAAYYRRQVRTGSQLSVEPSAADVGVKKDASDTAATLATRSDLGPKLWYREKNSETANEAALVAQKTDLSPEIWRPDPDRNAATAALQAKDRTSTVKSIVDYDEDFVHAQGKEAATKIAAVSGREYAARALPEVYSWRDNERMYTLPSNGSLSDAALPTPSPEFLASLESKARENAQRRLSQLYVGGPHLTKEHHLSASQSGAFYASEAFNNDDPLLSKPQFLDDAQKQSLISKARLRAANEIAAIEAETQSQNFLINKSYPDALKIAEALSKKRLENHGKIDMGGGKFMTQSEVEAIAERNVRPVLDQISEKALKQRQEDEEKRAADEADRQKRAEEKKAAADKKAEEKRIIAEQKAEEKRIKQEEKAAQKAERDKVKAAQRAENEKKKAEREKEAQRLRQERLAEKERTKHEKQVAAEQRKQEKIKLQAALDEAKQAEAIAAAEASRLRALKQSREDELEAARIAQEQAEESAKEQAEKEVAEKEAALAKAKKELEIAASKEKETHNVVQSAAHSVYEAEEAQSIAEEQVAESSRAVEQAAAEPEIDIPDTASVDTVKEDQPWQMVDKNDASREAVNGVAEKEDTHPVAPVASISSVKKDPISLPSVSPSKANGNFGGWFKRQASKVKGQRSKVLDKQKSIKDKGKEKVQELVNPEGGQTETYAEEQPLIATTTKEVLPVGDGAEKSLNENPAAGKYNLVETAADKVDIGEASVEKPVDTAAPAVKTEPEKNIEDSKAEKLVGDEEPEKLVKDEKESMIEDKPEESSENITKSNGSIHNDELDKLPEIDTSKLELPSGDEAKRASIFTESVA